ncbi:MAG: hypothetical protein ACRDFX_13325 [Chloroflexota bacterium]
MESSSREVFGDSGPQAAETQFQAAPLQGADDEEMPEIPSETERKAEELRLLYFGFATGMTIALVFLGYLVLEFAKWLP